MDLNQEFRQSQQDQGSPPGPQQAPLRSQVSSLMNSSPIGRTASGLSPFTSPQGLGSLAPAVLPGLWRRASLPSQVTLQQQMSSLGQAYLPEDTLDSMAQLVPYGSTINLPGQIEQVQSPQAVQGVTPIASPPAMIKARSPQRRPRSRQSSTKVAVQQAVSPVSKADRNGSAAVASLSSSESEDSESTPALPVTGASLSTAGTIWRKLLLAVAVLLIILAHDGLLVWGGFALANKYYGIRLDASHVAVNQALQVYGDPTSGNPFHSSQRSQGYSAHVRIASQDRVVLAQDTDEVLSFGTYPSSQGGPFQPHASLNAQANGSLAVQAGGLNLLPSGGETIIGSDGSEADLTVYGNIFVRPRSNMTNATTTAAQRRRRLQQSSTSSTSSNTTSSLSANLTQITNLTNAWQLDPANLTQQFGLHVYGSGASTGLIVESGSDQSPASLRLGPSGGNSTIRLANLGSAASFLLSYGQQPIIYVNTTHTLLYGVNGSSSISLTTNQQGASTVNIAGDVINMHTAFLIIITAGYAVTATTTKYITATTKYITTTTKYITTTTTTTTKYITTTTRYITTTTRYITTTTTTRYITTTTTTRYITTTTATRYITTTTAHVAIAAPLTTTFDATTYNTFTTALTTTYNTFTTALTTTYNTFTTALTTTYNTFTTALTTTYNTFTTALTTNSNTFTTALTTATTSPPAAPTEVLTSTPKLVPTTTTLSATPLSTILSANPLSTNLSATPLSTTLSATTLSTTLPATTLSTTSLPATTLSPTTFPPTTLSGTFTTPTTTAHACHAPSCSSNKCHRFLCSSLVQWHPAWGQASDLVRQQQLGRPNHPESLHWLQIWVDGPSMSNNIAVPDASGVFVVEAIAPLYVNSSGAVSIAQSQILQVGQLIAGSIGRSFSDINVPGSSVTTQQLSISQAGAAQDGSQDVTLGSLSASAASGSPTTVTLAAADGTAGTTGGNLALVAGGSSGTGTSALGGSVTIAAGTASAGGQHSILQLQGTDSTGSDGNILLSSTGNILLQSPVYATSSSTFGTTAADTMTVNALAAFQAAASVAGAFTAQGNVTLGESNAQSLTVKCPDHLCAKLRANHSQRSCLSKLKSYSCR
ncbi:TPA: hypothetical protein ACH3X3_001309 [Trebouxia sp. C0006]